MNDFIAQSSEHAPATGSPNGFPGSRYNQLTWDSLQVNGDGQPFSPFARLQFINTFLANGDTEIAHLLLEDTAGAAVDAMHAAYAEGRSPVDEAARLANRALISTGQEPQYRITEPVIRTVMVAPELNGAAADVQPAEQSQTDEPSDVAASPEPGPEPRIGRIRSAINAVREKYAKIPKVARRIGQAAVVGAGTLYLGFTAADGIEEAVQGGSADPQSYYQLNGTGTAFPTSHFIHDGHVRMPKNYLLDIHVTAKENIEPAIHFGTGSAEALVSLGVLGLGAWAYILNRSRQRRKREHIEQRELLQASLPQDGSAEERPWWTDPSRVDPIAQPEPALL